MGDSISGFTLPYFGSDKKWSEYEDIGESLLLWSDWWFITVLPHQTANHKQSGSLYKGRGLI